MTKTQCSGCPDGGQCKTCAAIDRKYHRRVVLRMQLYAEIEREKMSSRPSMLRRLGCHTAELPRIVDRMIAKSPPRSCFIPSKDPWYIKTLRKLADYLPWRTKLWRPEPIRQEPYKN